MTPSPNETARDAQKSARGAETPLAPGKPIAFAPLRWIVLAFATGLGTGFSPFASGTAGSFVGVLLFWFLAPPHAGWFAYAAATALLIGLAILAATEAERVYRKKDDGRVVIDEVVGYLVTMMWAPHTWQAAALGFVLFRVFDIVKPPPARGLEKLRAGVGIVVDDLVAGAYACISLHILIAVWPALGG